MLKSFLIFFVISSIVLNYALAQDTLGIYTSESYAKEVTDSSYQAILTKLKQGIPRTEAEKSWQENYERYLTEYYNKLPDEEKIRYQSRITKAAKPFKKPPDDEYDLTHRHIVNNGLFGYIYGIHFIAITGVSSPGAILGIPLLAMGANMMIPVFKDKEIKNTATWLSYHGKAMGYVQGLAFSILIYGEELQAEVSLSIITASSMGLSALGYHFGQTKSWSGGQVSLYKHYGTMLPYLSLLAAGALSIEDERVYAGAFMAFGGLGYVLANHVSKSTDYTRGDIVAVSSLATLNTAFGIVLLLDITYTYKGFKNVWFMIPVVTTLGSSLVGQSLLRDTHLTRLQGKVLSYITLSATLVTLGATAILIPVENENFTPHYVLPYVAGTVAFTVALRKYQADNRMELRAKKNSKIDLAWNLMPQNYLINRFIAKKAPSAPGAPLLGLSVSF